MKTFHCSACQALVFFENTCCLNCGNALAFSPARMSMVSLTPDENGLWRSTDSAGGQERFRLCANYSNHAVCNWALLAEDPGTLCRSCNLTHTVPDLGVAGSQEAWGKLETAKRRLVYALLSLGLPLQSKPESPQGVEFQFLSDTVKENGDRARVLTGHDDGLITINIAEADDIYRETMRNTHHEPYRTLLGHFRHEIGHYYWDLLVAGTNRLAGFRNLFGNEEANYQAALETHYAQGAPADWANRFISEYASTHPWEDWAESWAHVMHMVDALETIHAVGLSVQPRRPDEPALQIPSAPPPQRIADFDQLLSEWMSLTYVLNNLARGLGLADAYPFVISPTVVEKLRFVCQTMLQQEQISDSPPQRAIAA